MPDDERVRLLERALLSYVSKFGFTAEAREYFLQSYRSVLRDYPEEADRPIRAHQKTI
jgi:hypothetical protein